MNPDFKAHLFICTNDRGPNAKRESCAHKGSNELRDAVKLACKNRGLQGVRINSSGCLDQCEKGIAAVVYPKTEWMFDLKKDEVEKLVSAVEKALEKA